MAVCGILFAAQGPFVAWLGQLTKSTAIAVIALFALAGLGLTRFRSRNVQSNEFVLMTSCLLAFGNWGLLLGWWMDAGFAPVVGSALSGQPAFGLPWMQLGLLLFGLPAILIARSSGRLSSGRIRWLAQIGMGLVLGMSWGAWVSTSFMSPVAAQNFLVSLLCMVIGMFAGMFVADELSRALQRQPSERVDNLATTPLAHF